jgi:hypothetical protein
VGKTRTQKTIKGLTLDAGALIAIDRGDRRMIALLQQAVKERVGIRVPAGVVGQAWRDGARQVTLARFLRSREVEIPALDEHLARAAGELCGLTGTADVVDASVVLTARRERDTILTSDPDDLRKLDAGATIERV